MAQDIACDIIYWSSQTKADRTEFNFVSEKGGQLISLRTKDIQIAYNALALCVGFLAAPSIGVAVKTGFKVSDAITVLTRAEKTTLKNFTEQMISSAEAALKGFAVDLSPDAPVLYAQMLEQSVPKATDVAGTALDPDALARHMFAQLQDREHKSMRDLFLLLTAAALKPLLGNPDFVEQMKPAIYAQLIASTNAMQRDVAQLLEKYGTFDDAIATVKNAADTEFRILAAAFRLPDADTAPRSKIIADIVQKAQERDMVRATLQAIDDTDPIVQAYLDHAQTALNQLDLSAALFLLGEARKTLENNSLRASLQERAEIADTEAMVYLLNSQPLEAFRLFESTANGISLVDEHEAAMRRSNYALALMEYSNRYGGDGYNFGILIIDPLLSETAKDLPPEITARLFLHRGTIEAKLYAAVGHTNGQESFAAAEKDLISAQIIAAEILSDFHSAATARATAGWLYLQAAQFTYDSEADPYLKQAEELLSIAHDIFDQLEAPTELGRVKLDLADLLDRQSVRENESGRAEKFQKAITLVKESSALLADSEYTAELARCHHITAKLLWNEAVYRLGAGSDELLNSAMEFAEAARHQRAVEAAPLAWAETTLLIGEIRVDQMVHNHEKDRIAGLEDAEEIIQSAVKIYEEMGTEAQIANARDRSGRLKWLIEEEKGAL